MHRQDLPLRKSKANRKPKKLTEFLYDLYWEEELPIEFEQKDKLFTIEYSNYDESAIFLKENHKLIYQEQNSETKFLNYEFSINKEQYYRHAGDFFSYKHKQNIIGIFIGTPIDWSSYYLRSCSILPDFQGYRLYQKLITYMISKLEAHNVHRIEGEISPSNLKSVHVLNKLGFQINGINLSERWGSLIHFTKFISPDHRTKFYDQFCIGPQITPKK